MELEEIVRSGSPPAGFVQRAKIVLLLAESCSYQNVADKLDTSTPTGGKWKKRFLQQSLEGLDTQRLGQPPCKLVARFRVKILNATRRRPADGSTRWSRRKLAQASGISKDLVHRLWREADLARKLRRYVYACSKQAEPFRWKYSQPSRRIRHAETISATVR